MPAFLLANINDDSLSIGNIIAIVVLSVFLLIAIILLIVSFVKLSKNKKNTQTENLDNVPATRQEIEANNQAYSSPQQSPIAPQAVAMPPEPKSNHGFLRFLGIIFLILLIIGGVVFIAKCALKQASDGEFNSDGNPVLLNRAATLSDFTLTESVEATITNLKESYILVPNVDIKNLEITFKYYDSSKNLISTKTKNVGSVTKSSQYTISIEHSLSEIFKISTVSYYVTGGTVSYFG